MRDGITKDPVEFMDVVIEFITTIDRQALWNGLSHSTRADTYTQKLETLEKWEDHRPSKEFLSLWRELPGEIKIDIAHRILEALVRRTQI